MNRSVLSTPGAGFDVDALLSVNKAMYPGITRNARLQPATFLYVKQLGTASPTKHKHRKTSTAQMYTRTLLAYARDHVNAHVVPPRSRSRAIAVRPIRDTAGVAVKGILGWVHPLPPTSKPTPTQLPNQPQPNSPTNQCTNPRLIVHDRTLTPLPSFALRLVF